VSDPSPRARRLAAPRWLEPRLVVGVILVLASVVVGARVFATAGRYTEVYVARHQLVPGEHLAAGDLGVGRIRFSDDGGAYIAAASAPPLGYLVTRPVGLGELVPLAALSSSGVTASASRLVTVPVVPGHLPAGLGHGDLVDVYETPKVADGSAVPPPVEILASVAVDAAEGGSQSLTGSSTVSVVLAVPPDQVARVIHAVESGSVDVVRVPAAAAGAAPSPPPSASAAP
jgi:hypothetical protein